MEAYEIIYDDSGKVLGSNKLDINSLVYKDSKWIQYPHSEAETILEKHQILLTP